MRQPYEDWMSPQRSMEENESLRLLEVEPAIGEQMPSRPTSWHPALAWTKKTTIKRVITCSIGLAMLAFMMLAAPAKSYAQFSVGIAVSFGPPALPVYEQPMCPGPGYIWTPGFWAWDPDFGYYWVPGTWVMAPYEGVLWTPGYWGWDDDGDAFMWHEGYWGPTVGFYGGINYGYGYVGRGYEGGYWQGGQFYYNRTVNNVNTTNITNVYNKTVINNVSETRVSYNGGSGGVTAQPTQQEVAAVQQRRSGPIHEQQRQIEVAHSNPQQRATVNRGRPAVAATAKPGAFSGGEVVQARAAGAPYQPPKVSPREATKPAPRGAERSMPGNGRATEAAPSRREAQPMTRQPENRGAEKSMPGNERTREAQPPKHEAQPPMAQPQNRGAERSMPGNERTREAQPPKHEAQPPMTQPQNRGAERPMPGNERTREAQPPKHEAQPPMTRPENRGAERPMPGAARAPQAPVQHAPAKPSKPPKPEKERKPPQDR
jgi:YXWGXW repeat-containing protein